MIRPQDPEHRAYYAGIGSRETPVGVLHTMGQIAGSLAQLGYVLRSGGAGGADTAFSRAVTDPGMKRIFTPWRGFIPGREEDSRATVVTDLENYEEIEELASRFHPAWGNCKPGVRKLMARNVLQILGEDLNTPSEFVVCWTKNGRDMGGTGQALRVAMDRGIRIYNLQRKEDAESLMTHVLEALGGR